MAEWPWGFALLLPFLPSLLDLTWMLAKPYSTATDVDIIYIHVEFFILSPLSLYRSQWQWTKKHHLVAYP